MGVDKTKINEQMKVPFINGHKILEKLYKSYWVSDYEIREL
jgi:hypothetical protein